MRLVSLRGLTVDVHYRDDQNYDPSDHPHAPAGTGKGGQFVKKNAPLDTSVGFKKAEAHVRKLHALATEEGTTVIEKAAALKDYAGKLKSPYAMNYANKLIPWLEQEHGKPKGSLGKAVAAPGKSTGTAEGGEATPSAPKAVEVVVPKPPKYGKGFKYSQAKSNEMYNAAALAAPVEQKIESVKFLIQGVSPGGKSHVYGLQILKALGSDWTPPTYGKPEAPAAPKPDADAKVETLPPPFPDSTIQKKLYDAAASGTTKAEQLAALKEAGESVSSKSPFQQKYLKDLMAALGEGEPPSAPATPTKTEPLKNDKKTTSKRAKDVATLKEFASALDPDGGTSDHHKLTATIPTFTKASFDKHFTVDQRSSMSSYTGSGYAAINEVLRDPANASSSAVFEVNQIDDAFDHDAAKLTGDLVVRRGLSKLASTADKSQVALESIINGLKLGIPVKFSQRGFISTSLGHGYSSGIRMKILVKKGTPAIYVGAISNHSTEKELLLRHGQQFRVLEHEETSPGQHTLTLVTEG